MLPGLAKLAVSGAAMFLLLHAVDRPSLAEALSTADRLDLAAVLAAYLIGQALTAWRWQLLAERVGFREPFSTFLRHYYVGMFFNLFGPSTVGGDLVRGLYLGAPVGRRTAALSTVLFDRVSGLAMLVLVALGAVALFGRFGLPDPVVALVALAGVGMGVGWFALPPLARRFLPANNRVNVLLRGELGPLWSDRPLLARVGVASVGFHLLQCASLVLLGNALSMHVDWRYYFIFHPLVSVLSAVPVSIAGLGIREAGYVWFLQKQGVPGDTAMAFGVLWFVVLLVSSAAGGLVYLWSGAAVPTLRARSGAHPQGPGEAHAASDEAVTHAAD